MTDPLDPPPSAAPEPRLAHAETSEYCGPDQLCRVVLMLRRWDHRDHREGGLKEAALRRLLDLAFQVSLTTEEGRHPRFRIYVPGPAAEGSLRQVVRFEPQLELNDQLLRRIAPAVSSRNHAVQVAERDRRLYAAAIIGISDEQSSTSPGSHDVVQRDGIPGLMIRVDGPGILRVTEHGTWELRAGRIQPVHHYERLKVVRDWFSELSHTFLERTGSISTLDASALIAAALAAEARGDPPAESENRSDRDAAALFSSVWSFVLSTAIAAQHGGAFVILPRGVGRPPIHTTYNADNLDLLHAALGFWEACYDPKSLSSPAEAHEKHALWEAARRRMFSAARALADLANTDGCVVLDRKLRLSGFGGEIRVHDSDITGWRCTAAHHDTLAEEEPIELERFGTRHRSAVRLCAAVPGTTAFVISQDGDLRVFYGMPDRRVCMWRNLGAWMAASERW